MKVPEEEERVETLLEEIVAENFPNLVKEMDIQIQEIQRTLSIIYPKMFTENHVIIKFLKLKKGKEKF